MKDHPDTKEEISKINKAQTYLKENDIIDGDSFNELLLE